MGSLDWLTTIVGIVGFGAVETNPLLAGLTSTNLVAFTIIKLGTVVFVGVLFYQVEKALNGMANRGSKAFRNVRIILRSAYLASVLFLMSVLVNNVWATFSATMA